MPWVWIGLASSGVGGVGIVWALFGSETIKPWATAVGFVLACLLSLLGYVSNFLRVERNDASELTFDASPLSSLFRLSVFELSERPTSTPSPESGRSLSCSSLFFNPTTSSPTSSQEESPKPEPNKLEI